MKRMLSAVVIFTAMVALFAVFNCSNEEHVVSDAARGETTSTFAEQRTNQPSEGSNPKTRERMQGFKKMKEELRAKGINPDHPTNEDFRKALTGGRD